MERRHPDEAVVGPLGIVAHQPGGGELVDILRRREDVRVEDFGALAAVEAFDVGVLLRLSGLDIVDGDVLLRAPAGERDGRQLGAVVHANRLRCGVHELILELGSGIGQFNLTRTLRRLIGVAPVPALRIPSTTPLPTKQLRGARQTCVKHLHEPYPHSLNPHV